MVIGDFLWRWLAPLQRCSRPAWLYTGDRDTTRTHVGASHNWGRAELMYMPRVVIGSSDVPASELPKEDLALCNDPGRTALQVILTKYDAKGILEHVSGRALGPVRILGDDGDEARQDSGAARAPEAGTAGGAINPRDSRRAGKRP
ncbi:hypothetical protein E2562_017480 [Oryza meyeriana var. granulata]|uniref:Uncharacterized protein n=1 Tax=Oryza meyeriana var. granulata TaxID=110450 RepID=A0A6G1DYW6_9ORYZ|nr:hypothetical protein E2562_017480 [Oryza meyeriana var. granulata]